MSLKIDKKELMSHVFFLSYFLVLVMLLSYFASGLSRTDLESVNPYVRLAIVIVVGYLLFLVAFKVGFRLWGLIEKKLFKEVIENGNGAG
jgi:uncharacterized protein YacL